MPPSARTAFLPVTDKNVEVFKVINCQCLPVRYADKFYVDLLKTPGEFTKFGAGRLVAIANARSDICRVLCAATVGDVSVGGIGCRLEARADGKQDLYIMTLSVLTAYRKLGIGKLIHLVSLVPTALHFVIRATSCGVQAAA